MEMFPPPSSMAVLSFVFSLLVAMDPTVDPAAVWRSWPQNTNKMNVSDYAFRDSKKYEGSLRNCLKSMVSNGFTHCEQSPSLFIVYYLRPNGRPLSKDKTISPQLSPPSTSMVGVMAETMEFNFGRN